MCSRKGRCWQESKGWQGGEGERRVKESAAEKKQAVMMKKAPRRRGRGAPLMLWRDGQEGWSCQRAGDGDEVRSVAFGRGEGAVCAVCAARWHALARAQRGQEHSGHQGHGLRRLVARHGIAGRRLGEDKRWEGGQLADVWTEAARAVHERGGRQRGLECKDRQGEEVALHVLYGLGDTLAGAQRGIRRLRQGQGPRQPCPHRAGLMMCGKRWGLGLEKALVWLATGRRQAGRWGVG